MCDQHQHAKVETWITPENSRHLSSKMIQLFPGEQIPWHTTGPGREEVIVVIYGTLEIAFDNRIETASSGEAVFIPENTHHAVLNNSDAGAQYAYVVTKRTRPTLKEIEADLALRITQSKIANAEVANAM